MSFHVAIFDYFAHLPTFLKGGICLTISERFFSHCLDFQKHGVGGLRTDILGYHSIQTIHDFQRIGGHPGGAFWNSASLITTSSRYMGFWPIADIFLSTYPIVLPELPLALFDTNQKLELSI